MFNVLEITGSIILALIPAIVWGVMFYVRRPEDRHFSMATFIAGGVAVAPILLYKLSWDYFPWINAFKFADSYKNDYIGLSGMLMIPLSVIITFMFVGVLEEIMKYFAVKISDNNKLLTIDDAMSFFIMAALGFAFTENILYFYNIWVQEGPTDLFIPFMFRSLFSTFAHVMFSGIMGYYYGVAHFAKPILQEEIRANRHHWTKLFHKILSVRKERLFHEEKIAEGLLIAVGLHAIFNIFLEMNLTYLTVPFLVAGYAALTYLFEKKENHKKYEKLFERVRNHTANPHRNYFWFVKYFKRRRVD